MTRRALERRVERWRALLVPEWRITLMGEPPPDRPAEESYAVVQTDDDYQHARVWVNPTRYASDVPLGELDVTIVHELLHLLTRELRRTEDLLDGMVHRDVLTVIGAQRVHDEELLVERLARIIALLEHPDGLVAGVAWRDAD